MAKQIFVHLPVKNLERSVSFFTKTGFRFNPKLASTKSACMVISRNIFAILVAEGFFRALTRKEIADAKRATEVLLALSVESRSEVDNMISKAISAGGREIIGTQSNGWEYGRSFEDADGHIWEVVCVGADILPEE